MAVYKKRYVQKAFKLKALFIIQKAVYLPLDMKQKAVYLPLDVKQIAVKGLNEIDIRLIS